MVLESGWMRRRESCYELAGPLPPLAIPATLQDSLAARLDRLAGGRKLAQMAATLGREFTYGLLQKVAGWDDARLRSTLRELVEADLLRPRGSQPSGRYSFTHALIQDAAYRSLLRSSRQRYHRETAGILEQDFPDVVAAQPEIVAHHFTEAGLPESAITYWRLAGTNAGQRAANAEAISHFSRGLQLMDSLPENPERIRDELMLRMELGESLIVIEGHASSRVEENYFRAWELCQAAGEHPELFQVLFGLFMFYYTRADLPTAGDLGKQIDRLARRQNQPVLSLTAHHALGSIAGVVGDLPAARAHFEQAIELDTYSEVSSDAATHYVRVGTLGFCALVLWMLGYPEQSLRRIRQARRLAHSLGHPYPLAYVLTWEATLHQYRRDLPAAEELSDEAVRMSRDQGFRDVLPIGMILQGWRAAFGGDGEEGVIRIRRGIEAWEAVGTRLMRPYISTLLAEACGSAGRIDEGLAALDESLRLVEEIGERTWEAELHRLRGELLLRRDVADEERAASCFETALAVSRRQGAKSLELRAATSLARLQRRQGRTGDARQVLEPTFRWFTEGFATEDLRQAGELLEQLA